MSDNNPYEIYEKATLAIQHLKAKPGDILAVYFPANIDRQQMMAAAEMLSEATKEWGIQLMALPQGYNIEHIPKEEMNKMGWYKLHEPMHADKE